MKLKRWQGLDNINDPMDVGLKGLTIARNVDIDRKGQIETRQGFTRLLNMPIAAAWSDDSNMLVLSQAGVLYRLVGGMLNEVAQGIQGEKLTACEVAGNLYYSTDKQTGVINGLAHRESGVPIPMCQVTALAGGSLRAGRYMVNVTQVAADGRESGAMENQIITVNDGERIAVTAHGIEPDCNARIWVSGCDGEQCFHVADGLVAHINDNDQLLQSSDPLDRQYKAPMPPVDMMVEHKGVIVASVGGMVIHSDPLDYELFDMINAVLPFDGSLTMLKSIDNGVFVSTPGGVSFITGEAPDVWLVSESYPYQAMTGTAQVVDMNVVGEGGVGKGVLFATSKGICLGTNDGAVRNITERKLAMDLRGGLASMIDGSRYVLALQ